MNLIDVYDISFYRIGELQIQLRSATSQCVLHEKTTAGLPSGRGA